MRKPIPLNQAGDSANMIRAIAWCASQGLPVRRTSPIQIKVGPFNLYPDKGSWNSDLDPKRKPGGFAAFQDAVASWWDKDMSQYNITL